MKPAFKYSAIVTRVIDGDTIDCTVDLGFSIFAKERFRLYGIDIPEKNSKDSVLKEIAFNATSYVKESIEGKTVTIECTGKDKYGRWLAKVFINSMVINERLVELGLAKDYFGDNKEKLGW